MRIYTEVNIDMNPESSSYGETLHEESFEYIGPMILAETSKPDNWSTWVSDDEIDAAIAASGLGGTKHSGDRGVGYWSVSVGGENKWMVKVDTTADDTIGNKGYWLLLDTTGATGDDSSGGSYIGSTYDTIGGDMAANSQILIDWAENFSASESYEGFDYADTIDPAADIKYSDFESYIDQSTGQVTNVEGMMGYLKDLPGMDKFEAAELEAHMRDMPSLNIDPDELATKQMEAESDIYGLERDISGKHTELGEERQKKESQMGVSGIIGGGPGGLDKSITEGLYGGIKGLQSDITGIQLGEEDYYGLGGAEERELGDWIAGLLDL